MGISIKERAYLQIRSLLRSYLSLYKASRNLIGGKSQSHKWPNKKTDLYVAGFPRSGNTNTTWWIEKTDPALHVSSHFHMVATLRKALSLGTDILWVVREPSQCIASFAVYTRGHVAEKSRRGAAYYAEMALRDYIDYFRFASKHMDRMYVVGFELAVKRREQLLAMVQKRFNILADATPEMQARAMEERIKFQESDSRDPSVLSRPSEEKEKLKDEIRQILFSHPKYKLAEELYQAVAIKAEETEKQYLDEQKAS